jgi:hypothetical protein
MDIYSTETEKAITFMAGVGSSGGHACAHRARARYGGCTRGHVRRQLDAGGPSRLAVEVMVCVRSL